MVERTIRPKGKGWNDALGSGTPPASSQPLEQTVAASAGSQQASQPSKAAAAYPLQLRLDLLKYVYDFLTAYKDLPKNQIIQAMAANVRAVENPFAYVHAKLLVDNLGPDAFTIANLSRKEQNITSHFSSYNLVSEFETSMGLQIGSVRGYITAMCGPEALEGATELANASLDEVIDATSLPMLLPQVSELIIAAYLPRKATVEKPFNSPYFIVMEMPVPTRLLAAKTLSAAYASGALTAPTQQTFSRDTYDAYEQLNSSEKNTIMALSNPLPAAILQQEGTKLTLSQSTISLCSQAYANAWNSLRERLH